MDQPIEPKYRKQMRALGDSIDIYLNNGDDPKTTGYCLMIFPFERPPARDHVNFNYISNAEHSSIIAAMKEFIARAEGRFIEPGELKET